MRIASPSATAVRTELRKRIEPTSRLTRSTRVKRLAHVAGVVDGRLERRGELVVEGVTTSSDDGVGRQRDGEERHDPRPPRSPEPGENLVGRRAGAELVAGPRGHRREMLAAAPCRARRGRDRVRRARSRTRPTRRAGRPPRRAGARRARAAGRRRSARGPRVAPLPPSSATNARSRTAGPEGRYGAPAYARRSDRTAAAAAARSLSRAVRAHEGRRRPERVRERGARAPAARTRATAPTPSPSRRDHRGPSPRGESGSPTPGR